MTIVAMPNAGPSPKIASGFVGASEISAEVLPKSVLIYAAKSCILQRARPPSKFINQLVGFPVRDYEPGVGSSTKFAQRTWTHAVRPAGVSNRNKRLRINLSGRAKIRSLFKHSRRSPTPLFVSTTPIWGFYGSFPHTLCLQLRSGSLVPPPSSVW